jgi:hypothetical protein
MAAYRDPSHDLRAKANLTALKKNHDTFETT